jgi:hypothetical protein
MLCFFVLSGLPRSVAAVDGRFVIEDPVTGARVGFATVSLGLGPKEHWDVIRRATQQPVAGAATLRARHRPSTSALSIGAGAAATDDSSHHRHRGGLPGDSDVFRFEPTAKQQPTAKGSTALRPMDSAFVALGRCTHMVLSISTPAPRFPPAGLPGNGRFTGNDDRGYYVAYDFPPVSVFSASATAPRQGGDGGAGQRPKAHHLWWDRDPALTSRARHLLTPVAQFAGAEDARVEFQILACQYQGLDPTSARACVVGTFCVALRDLALAARARRSSSALHAKVKWMQFDAASSAGLEQPSASSRGVGSLPQSITLNLELWSARDDADGALGAAGAEFTPATASGVARPVFNVNSALNIRVHGVDLDWDNVTRAWDDIAAMRHYARQGRLSQQGAPSTSSWAQGAEASEVASSEVASSEVASALRSTRGSRPGPSTLPGGGFLRFHFWDRSAPSSSSGATTGTDADADGLLRDTNSWICHRTKLLSLSGLVESGFEVSIPLRVDVDFIKFMQSDDAALTFELCLVEDMDVFESGGSAVSNNDDDDDDDGAMGGTGAAVVVGTCRVSLSSLFSSTDGIQRVEQIRRRVQPGHQGQAYVGSGVAPLGQIEVDVMLLQVPRHEDSINHTIYSASHTGAETNASVRPLRVPPFASVRAWRGTTRPGDASVAVSKPAGAAGAAGAPAPIFALRPSVVETVESLQAVIEEEWLQDDGEFGKILAAWHEDGEYDAEAAPLPHNGGSAKIMRFDKLAASALEANLDAPAVQGDGNTCGSSTATPGHSTPAEQRRRHSAPAGSARDEKEDLPSFEGSMPSSEAERLAQLEFDTRHCTGRTDAGIGDSDDAGGDAASFETAADGQEGDQDHDSHSSSWVSEAATADTDHSAATGRGSHTSMEVAVQLLLFRKQAVPPTRTVLRITPGWVLRRADDEPAATATALLIPQNAVVAAGVYDPAKADVLLSDGAGPTRCVQSYWTRHLCGRVSALVRRHGPRSGREAFTS